MGWRMHGTKKCEGKLSKNSETSGLVSLLGKFILKSTINKHIFSSLLILENSGVKYSSLKYFVFILGCI